MEPQNLTQAEKIKRGAEDAGQYFRYMVEFVGFKPEDAEAIQESGLVVEKYLPTIVSEFYANLLRYPPTRKHFLRKDGTLDQDYLQKRMHHLTNFWRRTASGIYDDDYARYVDYVGRAHTSHGADPNIYIAERYVIGQVGFIQHAISKALEKELRDVDPELENRAVRAWNLLMMVILEMLARAYGDEREVEHAGSGLMQIDRQAMQQLAIDTYERGLGLGRPTECREVLVGLASEIPEGARKIVQVDELSIGLFHHKGQMVALRNHCLHRGGPVATGTLEGDTLTCPWHGYQYNVMTGELLVDPNVKLDTYPLVLKGDEIYLSIPEAVEETTFSLMSPEPEAAPMMKPAKPALSKNEFLVSDVPPGKTHLVRVDGAEVAVYNVGGEFYATAENCTHAGGPLDEGTLQGSVIICPWHGSCFDVKSGEVRCGPADKPVATYKVEIDGEIGRVGTKG
jgi:nitrite reductase/ring-hydroxylating ferredoxin subunit